MDDGGDDVLSSRFSGVEEGLTNTKSDSDFTAYNVMLSALCFACPPFLCVDNEQVYEQALQERELLNVGERYSGRDGMVASPALLHTRVDPMQDRRVARESWRSSWRMPTQLVYRLWCPSPLKSCAHMFIPSFKSEQSERFKEYQRASAGLYSRQWETSCGRTRDNSFSCLLSCVVVEDRRG